MTEAAWDLLSVMDEQAALANQKIDLFTNRERFPGVFEARENVVAADAALVRPSRACAPRRGVCRTEHGMQGTSSQTHLPLPISLKN